SVGLPVTAKGCRALFERRVGGISTVSGSRAVRGLRGARCLLALPAPLLLTNPSDIGGEGGPGPGPPFLLGFGGGGGGGGGAGARGRGGRGGRGRGRGGGAAPRHPRP